ncbi:LysR family transcriptional regulator [Pararhizobium sp. YC-54]|uniref:LysR family transcriptional regulator n=1 Tax=Pararhizobium sp. YC-54 TaxID=2986920 RepID=UPI0021F76C0E|nr:LysR family transcriptional regulator [Pararhizobium sp. YC-54]MCW0000655.1 LysR family transcriptional regulator [Pararhizobium sp. YC-54]
MDRLQSMRVLVKVADTGSFAQAARALNMSPPTVTRAIAYLEDLTGARLFLRSTRSVKLTAPGSRYVEDCRRILADINEAEASVGGSHATPSGLLTVTAPVLFGQIYVMPVLTSFLTRHPAVNGRALLLDRVVNLTEEGIDVALRIGQLPDSGYRAIKVGSVRRVICGAPAYFKEHPVPQVPADLAGHTIIANTGSSAPQDWRFSGEGNNSVTLRPRLFCNTMDAAISAASRGWGLARALSYQVASAVSEGKLDIVLADYEEAPVPIHVMHAEGRYISAKTRAFVDFLVAELRANQHVQAATSLVTS